MSKIEPAAKVVSDPCLAGWIMIVALKPLRCNTNLVTEAQMQQALAEAQARILHLESICAAYLPPNIHLTDYSSLNEALAQECERLAAQIQGTDEGNNDETGRAWDHARLWLHDEAAAHRTQTGEQK